MEEIFNISILLESEGICIKRDFWANSHASTLLRQGKNNPCRVSSDVLYMLKSVKVQDSPFPSREASRKGSLKHIQHKLAVPC